MGNLEDIESRLIGLNALLIMGIQEARSDVTKVDQANLTPHERKKLQEQADWKEIRANQGHRAELLRLLDELGKLYLDTDPDQRQRIRDIVADKREVLSALNSYIWRAIEKFESTGDVQWVYVGLAAVSIEDLRFDYRDTIVALGELFITAAHAGIDPLPLIQRVASISSSEKTYAGTSTREFLDDFDRSTYFEETVIARLRNP